MRRLSSSAVAASNSPASGFTAIASRSAADTSTLPTAAGPRALKLLALGGRAGRCA